MAHFKGTSILIITSDSVVMRVIDRLFAKMRYHADYVNTADKALYAVAAKRYDLILLGLDPSQSSGFYLAEKIRQAEKRVHQSSSYLCAVTNQALASVREACLDSGFDDVVAKPVGQHFLEHLIIKARDHADHKCIGAMPFHSAAQA